MNDEVTLQDVLRVIGFTADIQRTLSQKIDALLVESQKQTDLLECLLQKTHNLHVSNTQKWGSKISAAEFATTESLLQEMKERRQKEQDEDHNSS